MNRRLTWLAMLAGTLLMLTAASYAEEPVSSAAQPVVAAPPSNFKDPRVQVIFGGAVTLGNQQDPDYRPHAVVLVDWNLAGQVRALEAHVEADFVGLPDSEVTLRDARQFDALEMSLGTSYRPIPKFSGATYCEAGFASRLERSQPAVTSAPLWSSCGLRFEDKGPTRARLKVGVGPDERLGYGWQVAAHVSATMRLLDLGPVGATLSVRAILGLETPVGATQRTNIVSAGVGVSWASKK